MAEFNLAKMADGRSEKVKKQRHPLCMDQAKRVRGSFHSFIESLVVPGGASFVLKLLKYDIRHKLMLEKVCKFW